MRNFVYVCMYVCYPFTLKCLDTFGWNLVHRATSDRCLGVAHMLQLGTKKRTRVSG